MLNFMMLHPPFLFCLLWVSFVSRLLNSNLILHFQSFLHRTYHLCTVFQDEIIFLWYLLRRLPHPNWFLQWCRFLIGVQMMGEINILTLVVIKHLIADFPVDFVEGFPVGEEGGKVGDLFFEFGNFLFLFEKGTVENVLFGSIFLILSHFEPLEFDFICSGSFLNFGFQVSYLIRQGLVLSFKLFGFFQCVILPVILFDYQFLQKLYLLPLLPLLLLQNCYLILPFPQLNR